MGVGLVNLDIGEILSSAGNLFKDIRTAITGIDPVKAAELNLKLADLEGKLAEYQSKADEMTKDDRVSARSLGAEYVRAGKTNWRQNILAVLAMFLLIGVVVAIFVVGVQPAIRDIVLMILGGLLKIVYDIYAYDFGGSYGSQQKNSMIEGFIEKLKK
jgi:hypothetical protein